MNTPFYGTETDFIKHETRVWGEEYVDDLLNRGYTTVLTSVGWKWLLPSMIGGRTNTLVTNDSRVTSVIATTRSGRLLTE